MKMKLMPRRDNQRLLFGSGFTLVELLIVMSIISMLITIAVVSFRGAQLRARDTQRKADLRQYQNALEIYANSHNSYYPHQPSVLDVSVICGATQLNINPCVDDPRPESAGIHYKYGTTGSGVAGTAAATNYVLYAKMESADEWWVACSEGRSNIIPGTTTPTPTCPI